MRQRQEAEHLLTGTIDLPNVSDINICSNVIRREHHALAEAGGAGGVAQEDEIAIGHLIIDHITPPEAGRVALLHQPVGIEGAALLDRRALGEGSEGVDPVGGSDRLQLLGIKRGDMLRADEDHLRVGVLHEMHRILGGESRQDRHQHSAVRDHPEPDDTPLCTILAQQCHMIPLRHAGGLEEEVNPRDTARRIGIAVDGTGVVVAERGADPVLAERLLKELYQWLLDHLLSLLL